MEAVQAVPPLGRLLVVDDEENILRTIKRVLRRTGWEIETASDGRSGLEALERFQPEVVVSDFRMPGMTGVEFLAAVKSQSPLTQRIMLTGQADQTAIEDAINRSEIFRFVSKPWNDAQLVLTIKSAFEQRALLLENERLLRLTQEQNEALRGLNQTLEDRVKDRTRRMLESEKMAAVGQLAGGVAHEINNPLGGILAFSQLMQRDEGRSEQDMEALQLMEESALRCKRIIESLLKFSRRGSPQDRTPTSLNRFVEDTALLFKAQMKGWPRAVLELKLDPNVGIIHGNGAELSQALLNLLQNGLSALPDKEGALTVSTGRAGERVFFRVTDTGVGIEAANLPHIFEPSFTTRAPGEGTGLGLSIAYRIVEDHGGEFAVETAPKAGSTFTVFLPQENP